MTVVVKANTAISSARDGVSILFWPRVELRDRINIPKYFVTDYFEYLSLYANVKDRMFRAGREEHWMVSPVYQKNASLKISNECNVATCRAGFRINCIFMLVLIYSSRHFANML